MPHPSAIRDVCSQHAVLVDRQGSVGVAPVGDNKAWKVPIEIMLDLPRLRSYYPVILTAEFMRLHGIDQSNELLTGHWNRDIHQHENMASFHAIPNPQFDDDVFRVDTVFPFLSNLSRTDDLTEKDTQIDAGFREAAGEGKKHLSWDNAVHILRSNGHYIDDDATAEMLMNHGGWVVTYTYEGLGGNEFAKSVVPSTREILPRSHVRGWVEDFTMDVDVLLLEGEIHLERKPASLRFATSAARDNYTHFVLSYMQPTSPLILLSEKLAKRMTRLSHGRGWFSTHMRRGDFIRIGWVKDQSLEAHLKHVKDVFEQGRKKLTSGRFWFWSGGMPRRDDPYFVATDERTKESLTYIRKNGAITIYELLTDEDRRQIGWPLLFTDVLGIVEQRIAASSMFFYGPALSSLSGGVLNIRATMGLDSSSWIVD
ncbi:hypothetical protein Clacol_008055 [Clathrus columnatus]|uniref:Uncharacterized protein n=1 Tax=Clathrus columnatus TaxID=1419009 RepID=A0AAV5AM75_9AGAM|nr:hypothetical protein Clacol_008055 [Clathrus columnatus]